MPRKNNIFIIIIILAIALIALFYFRDKTENKVNINEQDDKELIDEIQKDTTSDINQKLEEINLGNPSFDKDLESIDKDLEQL